MAVSARNQLTGTVNAVAMGAVNDEVELTLAGGAKLVAIVTHSSQQALGLLRPKYIRAGTLPQNGTSFH